MASDFFMTDDYGPTHMGLHMKISYRPATLDCMEKETLAERVKRLRKAKELNQTQLAEAVGIHQTSILDIEKHGAQPTMPVFVALARALNVSLDHLATGVDQQASAWPFKRVPLARILRLSPDDRGYVEGKLEEILDRVEGKLIEEPKELRGKSAKPKARTVVTPSAKR
jgi:transcriptional regulator with XRE-family HTH domain